MPLFFGIRDDISGGQPGCKTIKWKGHQPSHGSGNMRLKILLVDDQHDAIELLSLLLGLDGHEARTAENGPEALRIAANWKPDLVLVDLGMPGMNGYEIASCLRQLPGLENSRVVAVSGYAAEWDLLTAAGIDHHVLKPLRITDLRSHLGSVSAARQRRRLRVSFLANSGDATHCVAPIAVGHRYTATRLYEVATGKLHHELQRAMPGECRFSPDGKTLAVGYANGECGLWDTINGKLLRSWHAGAEENNLYAHQKRLRSGSCSGVLSSI